MMRQIVLSEEHGLYRLRNTYGSVIGQGPNVERALRQAFEGQTGVEGDELNLRSTVEAAQLLEDFLGQRREDPEEPVTP